jgi:hypothetical protein
MKINSNGKVFGKIRQGKEKVEVKVYQRVRTKPSGCPLITLCGGSFSQEKPWISVSFVRNYLIFVLFV